MAWTDEAREAALETRRRNASNRAPDARIVRPSGLKRVGKRSVPDSVYARGVSRPQMAAALRSVRKLRDKSRINKGTRFSSAAKVMNPLMRERAFLKIRASLPVHKRTRI